MLLFNPEGVTELLVTNLNQVHPDILMLTPFGSRMYGTNTEDSDWDFVAVYMPRLEEIAVGNIPEINSRRYNVDGSIQNTGEGISKPSDKNTIEVTFVSLPFLLDGYLRGIIQNIETMSFIKSRHDAKQFDSRFKKGALTIDFLNRFGEAVTAIDLAPMIAFSKKSLESTGKRLLRLQKFKEMMAWMDANRKSISNVHASMPEDFFNSLAVTHKLPMAEDKSHFLVYEKPVNKKSSFDNLYRMLEALTRTYAGRSHAALENGFDSKHALHSYRLVLQAKEILLKGYVTYPMTESKILLDIKTGKIEPVVAIKMAEDLMSEVEGLINSSPNLDTLRTTSRNNSSEFLARNALYFYQHLKSL